MRNRERRSGWLTAVAVALLCPVPSVLAQGTITMTLTSPGDNIVGNVYVDPYYAMLGTSAGVIVICDDYGDETYQNESWTATVSPLADVSGQTVKWSAGVSYSPTGVPDPQPLDQQTAYDEVAWLSEKLLSATDPTVAGEISYAIWAVFDAKALTDLAGISSTDFQGTLSWINQAQTPAARASGESSNFSLLTPVSGTSGPPQEFVVRASAVHTAEAPGFAILGLNLLGAGVLAFFFRRRTTCN